MKNTFIKLFVVFIVLSFIRTVSAEDISFNAGCSTSDIIELNSIANYVTLDFEYDEELRKFNIIIENLNPYISAIYYGKTYRYSSKGTVIKGVGEGNRINIGIIASEYSECYSRPIRTITYVVPHINKYLNTKECMENPNAEICNTKFINYDLTYSLFINMLEKEKKVVEVEPELPEVVKTQWYDIYLEYLDKYGMQVLLFMLGALTTFIIGHGALVRAKEKF